MKSQKPHFKFGIGKWRRDTKGFLSIIVDFFCPPPPSYRSSDLWRQFREDLKPYYETERRNKLGTKRSKINRKSLEVDHKLAAMSDSDIRKPIYEAYSKLLQKYLRYLIERSK